MVEEDIEALPDAKSERPAHVSFDIIYIQKRPFTTSAIITVSVMSSRSICPCRLNRSDNLANWDRINGLIRRLLATVVDFWTHRGTKTGDFNRSL